MAVIPRQFRPHARTAVLALGVTVAALLTGALVRPVAAHADVTTVSQDTLRTGWDRAEPGLAPATVSGSDFGRLFATQLDGQIYAQPIVAGGTVLAATENDKVYGLDPVTGVLQWTRDVGPAWPAGAIGCGDLVPNIGVTATPVYDASTGTAYFTAKVDDGPDQQHPHWYMHAVDITTGAERAGFPTMIAGAPSNDPAHTFKRLHGHAAARSAADGRRRLRRLREPLRLRPVRRVRRRGRRGRGRREDDVVHRGRVVERAGGHLAVRRRSGVGRRRPDHRCHRQRCVAPRRDRDRPRRRPSPNR